MAKGKLIKAGVKKVAGIAKKPKSVTGIGKKVKPYAKFKSKQAEIAKSKAKLMGERMPTKAKKPGFKTGVAAGTAVGVAASKGAGLKKAQSKESPTKRMAGEAYKKQKEKQKKYYDKRRESKGK